MSAARPVPEPPPETEMLHRRIDLLIGFGPRQRQIDDRVRADIFDRVSELPDDEDCALAGLPQAVRTTHTQRRNRQRLRIARDYITRR